MGKLRKKLEEAKQKREASAEQSGQLWGEPVPLSSLEERVPLFPIEVFPPQLAECAVGISKATSGHLDYVCCSMLAVVSGLIGDRATVEVKKGFEVSPPIWLALVGRSGAAKSPPLAAVAKRVHAINREQVEKFPEPPSRYPLGEGEFVLGTVQMETLLRLLRRQSLGSLMILDELRSWIRSWDQYRSGDKGQDRQHALALFDGAPLAVHRSNYSIHLQRPRLGVIGAIQPTSMGEIFQGAGDGLPPRFLWCFPDEVSVVGEQWHELDDLAMKPWHQVIDLVRSIPVVTEFASEEVKPIVYKLSPEAREPWGEMSRFYAEEMNNPEHSPAYIECLSKLRGGMAAKLALALKVIHTCFTSSREVIDSGDVMRARMLVDYFAQHAQKLLGVSGIDPRLVPSRVVLAWIHRKGKTAFATSDCYRDNRKVFSKPEDAWRPLALLERLNLIRKIETVSEKLGRGRPPSTVYEVHPHLLDPERFTELSGIF